MNLQRKLQDTTVFVGCGFAAKYRLGGGNFSVPLQWLKGLQRLGLSCVWLELMPATPNPVSDAEHIQAFKKHLSEHGLDRNYCLLHQTSPDDAHDLSQMVCHGMSKSVLQQKLAGPTILLNLSHSLHPPLVLDFERRIYCDLDPSEISYWMPRIEMGQSYHHEFWTIGLNKNGPDCTLPKQPVSWKTFYPLVDTELHRPAAKPAAPRFTTIGQWYWHQGIEIGGEYPDFSKQVAFARYMTLPSRVPEVEMELAMNLNADDPERERIQKLGWKWIHPHNVASTPHQYRRYIAGATAEFTACKGLDLLWKTGWVSDRAAAFLATGRPVITEDTRACAHLPGESGFLWVNNLDEAVEAVRRVIRDWDSLSKIARDCAVEYFDSARNLQRILSS